MVVFAFIKIALACIALESNYTSGQMQTESPVKNKPPVFHIKAQMGKDTLVIGENMPVTIFLEYQGKRKVCLQDNMTNITFFPVAGWEQVKKDSMGRIYNGPNERTMRCNESIAYSLNLADHFVKFQAGSYTIEYQIKLYKCGSTDPIILKDSVSVVIRNQQ